MIADPDVGIPGDPVTIIYTVRNDGDVRISSIVITDEELGEVGKIPALDPGYWDNREMETTFGPSEYRGSATGRDNFGDPVSDSANVRVTLVLGSGPIPNPGQPQQPGC